MSERQAGHESAGNGAPRASEPFITVPARARQEIGELTFYLEQALRNLAEVNAQIIGSSETMPGVLHDLREIIAMTESATVRVLDETEALVDEGREVAGLIAELRAAASPDTTERLEKVDAYVSHATDRAMAIISALEFQDLTTQKVQRAFGLLEEVLDRLGRIRVLVDLGQPTPEPVAPPSTPPIDVAADPQSAQALVDELLQKFNE